MSTHLILLIGVSVYFGIGALISGALATVNHGFTGRIGWEVPALFFAWPLALLLKIPGALFFIPALTAAGLLTLLAHWVLP